MASRTRVLRSLAGMLRGCQQQQQRQQHVAFTEQHASRLVAAAKAAAERSGSAGALAPASSCAPRGLEVLPPPAQPGPGSSGPTFRSNSAGLTRIIQGQLPFHWSPPHAPQARSAHVLSLPSYVHDRQRSGSNHGGQGKDSGQRAEGSWKAAGGFASLLLAAGSLLGLSLSQQVHAKEETSQKEPVAEDGQPKKTKVVVLGSGWGAVSFLKNLDTSRYEVTVISPRNFFVFTPLLPQVTVGTVEARSVAEPIRRIIATRKKDATYIEAEALEIDPEKKVVRCREVHETEGAPHLPDFNVSYDRLVVAVGAEVNTFNTKGVKEHCHFLKEIDDAEAIQRHVVDCFEAAAMPGRTEEEKKRLLTFVVVGGGPSGVEFAAELHDLIVEDMNRLYPQLKGLASINLIEALDHVLNMFDKRLTEFAEAKFKRDGINFIPRKLVVEARPDEVLLKDTRTKEIESLKHGGLVVWSTGIRTRPLVYQFMGKIGQQGRRIMATDEWLRVKGVKDVWAVGDCATIEGRKLKDNVAELLKLADKDGTGVLGEQEFREVLKKMEERYPQMVIYLQRRKLADLLQDFSLDKEEGKEAEEDEFMLKSQSPKKLSIKKFLDSLDHIDAVLKNLPATAQVAAQQGDYLAHSFNKVADPGFKPEGPVRITGEGRHALMPFRYKHLGQFATFGGGEAGVQLPGDWVSVGKSTQWLWYSVYASKQVSWRTRFLVIFDWCKAGIFGRDSSRL